MNMKMNGRSMVWLLLPALALGACDHKAREEGAAGPATAVDGKPDDGNALAARHIISYTAEGEEKWLFTFPTCLPSCTSADVKANQTEGFVESRFLSTIQNAEVSIEFAMFTFSRQPIFQALLAAAKRGVKIRGIVDKGQFGTLEALCPLGQCTFGEPFSSEGYLNGTLEQREQLAAATTEYKKGSVSEKLALLLYRLPNGSGVKTAPGKDKLVHHKMVRVDGTVLLTGSGNWSSTAVSVNMENLGRFSSEKDPSVVQAFGCAFEAIWAGNSQTLGKDTIACLTDRVFFTPIADARKGILPRLLQAIDSAAQTIDIAMHHLVHPDIFAHLEGALDRGAHLRLLVDNDDCPAELEPEVESLLKKGTEIRYMPTNCAIFQLSHNKFGIFDGTKVINGSANWSKAGLNSNYENFFILTEPSDVTPFVQFFTQGWDVAQVRSECTCEKTDPECRKHYCLDQQFN